MSGAYNSLADEIKWSQKYRPTKIEDCIASPKVFPILEGIKRDGKLQDLLLYGTQGTGKTTVAWALCEEMGYEYITINGSNDGALIETLRTRITNFATTVSLSGQRKCVILDEGDFLTQNKVQPALRNFMEAYSSNCSFIMTCNYKSRILPALQSRFALVDFSVADEDLNILSAKMFKRVLHILDSEGVKYDKEAVAEVIKKLRPDWRAVINALQKYSVVKNEIDVGILAESKNADVEPVIEALKTKNYKEIFEWSFTQQSFDIAKFGRDLIDGMKPVIQLSSLPNLILLIAQYQQKHLTAIDPCINILAMLTEIMLEVKFK